MHTKKRRSVHFVSSFCFLAFFLFCDELFGRRNHAKRSICHRTTCTNEPNTFINCAYMKWTFSDTLLSLFILRNLLILLTALKKKRDAVTHLSWQATVSVDHASWSSKLPYTPFSFVRGRGCLDQIHKYGDPRRNTFCSDVCRLPIFEHPMQRNANTMYFRMISNPSLFHIRFYKLTYIFFYIFRSTTYNDNMPPHSVLTLSRRIQTLPL